MTTEKWREIPGFPDYDVSTEGRVRSWRGNRWHRASEPRVLKAAPANTGYPRVTLREKDGRDIYRLVHQLVLEVFVGPRPAGYHGAHGNGNPTDNRLANLSWKTPAENSEDRKAHGTYQVGETATQSKLTNGHVATIRRLRADGLTHQQIADHLGGVVAKGAVGAVLRGTTWRTAP